MSDLAVLRDATQMLAELRSIPEAVDLWSKAEAARVMAERLGYGVEAQNHATRIKLHTERWIAGYVDEGQSQGTIATRETGAGRPPKIGSDSEPIRPATYRELGLSKRQVAEARSVAEFTEQELDDAIDKANRVGREVRRDRIIREGRERRTQRQRAEAPPPAPLTTDLADIRHCSIEDLDIEPGSARLILTDPPYPQEFLPLWSTLGEKAAEWLMPGGLLVAYTGCFHLPEVIAQLDEHLPYWWTLAVVHDGAFTQIRSRRVNSGWKPLVVFHQPGRSPHGWPSDVLTEGQREKSGHEWQQAEAEAATLIEALTEPGDLIVDPFLGSGTTAAAAVALGRRVIGCDIEAAHVKTAQERVA